MASFVSNPAISMANEGLIYHHQDLARMRHAYHKACHDGPIPPSSDSERASLAKAIVSSYSSGLTEQELVLAARNLEK